MSLMTPLGELGELMGTYRSGFSLPGQFYTRDNVFSCDMEKVHLTEWLFAGHSCELRQPGDYITYDVAGESALIIRRPDRRLNAFRNFCRHRGSRLCAAESGTKTQLTCPYHAWAYDLDGRLRSARLMGTSFDPAGYGLHSLPVEEFAGMVFVCFNDQEPPDLSGAKEVATELYRPYHLDRTQVAKERNYVVESNWKIIAENFRECYHCPPAHPQYCRAIAGAGADGVASLERRAAAAREAQRQHWDALGLKTTSINFAPGRAYLIDRLAYAEGYTNQSLHGGAVAPLLGDLTDADVGVLVFTLRPNLWVEVTSDHFITMRHTPLSATSTQVRMTWLVREGAVAAKDYDPEDVSAFWTVTGEQDWEICANTQRGVTSRWYTPGPLAPSEVPTSEWLEWYIEKLRR